MVFSTDVKPLNEYGYGLTSLNTIKIYVSYVENPSNDYTCPDAGCVFKQECAGYTKASAIVKCLLLDFAKDGGFSHG